MSGPVPLAGVVGHPVGHSRSPALHGHWLRTLGIAGHYVPLDVAPEDLGAVLAALPRAGFRGLNVTIPHKEAALALAETASDRARRVGAANTLSFDVAGRIHADTTDGEGFLAALREGAPGWQPDDGPALVFGAGGAARSIVDALVQAGVPEIRLVNRTRSRAEALQALGAPGQVRVGDWQDAAAAARGVRLAVNTTSLGMQGQPPFAVDLSALPYGAVATDIVYTPLVTPFLQAAAQQGAQVIDGLGMLLHQAAPGFEAWFGRRPAVTAALRDAVLGR